MVYVDVVFPLLQTRLLPDLTIKMSNTAGVFPLLQTRLLPDLTIKMSNTTGVLKEAGKLSSAPVFTPVFWWGPCCSSSIFLCCVLLFYFSSLCVVCPMLSVSELSIFDSPFNFFSNIYLQMIYIEISIRLVKDYQYLDD